MSQVCSADNMTTIAVVHFEFGSFALHLGEIDLHLMYSSTYVPPQHRETSFRTFHIYVRSQEKCAVTVMHSRNNCIAKCHYSPVTKGFSRIEDGIWIWRSSWILEWKEKGKFSSDSSICLVIKNIFLIANYWNIEKDTKMYRWYFVWVKLCI